jgi:hypothetical protein
MGICSGWATVDKSMKAQGTLHEINHEWMARHPGDFSCTSMACQEIFAPTRVYDLYDRYPAVVTLIGASEQELKDMVASGIHTYMFFLSDEEEVLLSEDIRRNIPSAKAGDWYKLILSHRHEVPAAPLSEAGPCPG